MNLDVETTYVLGGAVGFLATVTLFVWRASWWTSDQFRAIRQYVHDQVQHLEDKFDHRHESNVERFAKIEAKLDIVIKNGN